MKEVWKFGSYLFSFRSLQRKDNRADFSMSHECREYEKKIGGNTLKSTRYEHESIFQLLTQLFFVGIVVILKRNPPSA